MTGSGWGRHQVDDYVEQEADLCAGLAPATAVVCDTVQESRLSLRFPWLRFFVPAVISVGS